MVRSSENPIIETEYGITAKPITLGDPIFNVLLERIHQVLGNLIRTFNISTQTYVDEDDPWTGILAAAVFEIRSRTNRKKGYSPGQLIFGCGTILLINHMVDWEFKHQQKQMQINRDNILENKHSVDYDYKVGDDVMITKHTAYKSEMPNTGLFVITRCWNNVTVSIQIGATKIR